MKRTLLVFLAASALAQSPLDFLNHNRPVVDAHNCYPYEGKWADRIDRALSFGYPVAIEQDIAWARDIPVVSHTAKTSGAEPSLRDHFFERVRPLMEKALKENDRAHWPLIVVHFDFKDLREPVIKGVWSLLGEYEGWITTAIKTDDPRKLSPFDPKPLLVLTEEADEQQAVFFDAVPVGNKLRVFGSAHTARIDAPREQRAHVLATIAPEKLLAEGPTNYRRWWNSSWHVVEEGGQTRAGEWTAAKDARLRALVDHAHRLGLWIRFYTLDGFTEETNRGWDKNYNFGSRAAAEVRWKAALAAGVNLIASDQYEDLARVAEPRR